MTANILIVEDKKEFVEELEASLDEGNVDASLEHMEFEEALNRIGDAAPDVLVLDVYEGMPEIGDPRGKSICEIGWSQNFIPLIFASASVLVTMSAEEWQKEGFEAEKKRGGRKASLQTLPGYYWPWPRADPTCFRPAWSEKSSASNRRKP